MKTVSSRLAAALCALVLWHPVAVVGLVYDDSFASDTSLNPGLVSLPGGQGSFLGYQADDEDLCFQSHDVSAVGGANEGGGYLRLMGVRFRAGRTYTMTVEAAQWRGNDESGLAYEAGFFPAPPVAIDDPIPFGGSGVVHLPAGDADGTAGPYFTHPWTFVAPTNAIDPYLVLRTARTIPDESRIVINRIRLVEHKNEGLHPLRILCVGDSITAGYTTGIQWAVPFAFGYRSGLFRRMVERDMPFQFVGASPQPYNLAFSIVPPDTLAGKLLGPDLRQFDQDHHHGWAGAGISGGIPSGIEGWIDAEDPDVILLMIGINAIPSSDTDPGKPKVDLQILVRTILAKFVADDRTAHLIVAQITPRTTPNASIVEYNRFIREDLVPGLIAQGHPISTVDQYSNFLDGNGQIDLSLFAQANHPNNLGYAKMAETWFQGLVDGGLVPSPLELWRMRRFPPSDLQDPAKQATVWGDEADPDGDLQHNALEYRFGGDPLTPDAQNTKLKIDSGMPPQMTYRRRRDDPGLNYAPVKSSDLKQWTGGPGVVEEVAATGLDDEIEQVLFQVVGLPQPDAACVRIDVTDSMP